MDPIQNQSCRRTQRAFQVCCSSRSWTKAAQHTSTAVTVTMFRARAESDHSIRCPGRKSLVELCTEECWRRRLPDCCVGRTPGTRLAWAISKAKKIPGWLDPCQSKHIQQVTCARLRAAHLTSSGEAVQPFYVLYLRRQSLICTTISTTGLIGLRQSTRCRSSSYHIVLWIRTSAKKTPRQKETQLRNLCGAQSHLWCTATRLPHSGPWC